MSDLPVAVFQAEWPLQKQTTNLVRMLRSAGHHVDVFLYGVLEQFETFSGLEDEAGIRVFRLEHRSFHSAAGQLGDPHRRPPKYFSPRIINSLFTLASNGWAKTTALAWTVRDWACYAAHLGDTERLLPKTLLAATTTHIAGRNYLCMFGVERLGLVWAGLMAQKYGTKLVYFSLELYTKDFPGLNDPRSRRLKRLECRFHKLSDATIVQDVPRANILFADTGAEPNKVFYVPVSLLGPPILEKPRVMRDRFQIPDGITTILMFGNMFGVRYVQELVVAAQAFPKEWLLVMHGPAPGKFMQEKLRALDQKNKVVISTDLLPPAQVDEFVASADIGLALYPRRTMNEYLTGKSSEKVAFYAKAGVPVIAFDYPSFSEVFHKFNSGVTISSISQLSAGIRNILENYQSYRQGALQSYRDVYEFSQHFGDLKLWLNN